MKCSTEDCSDGYTGKSARRIIERVIDHGGRDTKSHVLKYSSENEHLELHRKTLKLSAVILKTADSKGRSLRHY